MTESEIRTIAQGLKAGDRTSLARAITLIESTRTEDVEASTQLLEICLPNAIDSFRIGITGIPGVGKSTFIEALGTLLLSQGHKVAVLAIDPSSNISKGSILGDKTRMEMLAADKNAFVRPSPTGGSLGGVARRTRETVSLCEAAGFDIVVIETVGVGQSEVAARSMVDMLVLMVLANAGDELQGIKRGIMEMADMVVINKSDGEQQKAANRSLAMYRQALHYFPARKDGWKVPVMNCSAIEKTGIDTIWQSMKEYAGMLDRTGERSVIRAEQNLRWMNEAIDAALHEKFFNDDSIRIGLKDVEEKVKSGKLSPFKAAHDLLDKWRQSN